MADETTAHLADVIYVLVPDYGVEGLAEPQMAFTDAETAKQALALIEKNPSASHMRLCTVPVWKR